ncbi:hypothetical protein [Sphaerisporangium aureirubrum]|uniref:Uncharacterized protein n=1 Tax=Sphaerisporangium aureirubrum TaxID=1544736 RepID=A0ABW1NDB2_9ACTN
MTTSTLTRPAARSAPPAVIIPPQPDGAISCWRRLVKTIDTTRPGAFALEGPWLQPGVAYELTAGAVVIVVDRYRDHWHVRMTTAQNEGLTDAHTWTVKSPLGKRVVDYLTRRLPSDAARHHAHRLESMPNRYPGRCSGCRREVPAGKGLVLPGPLRGIVTHLPGGCPPPPQVITPNRWAGICGACGGWVQAGEGVAVRLTAPRPVTGGRYEQMHNAPCPVDAPPGPPNRQPGWCADCGELVTPDSGYWLRNRLHHHRGCPPPTVSVPTWIGRVPPGELAAVGEATWVRLRLGEGEMPLPISTPGYRVLDDRYVELVGFALEVIAGRRGRRTRARFRLATPDEAADLLAGRLASAELARPHATGFRARWTAEKIGETRPWLAEITGRDATYGYRREFISPERDYKHASSTGARGVRYGWTLAVNRVYEASSPQTWSWTERKFLRVTPEGDIVGITGEEVEAWLDNAAVWIAS